VGTKSAYSSFMNKNYAACVICIGIKGTVVKILALELLVFNGNNEKTSVRYLGHLVEVVEHVLQQFFTAVSHS